MREQLPEFEKRGVNLVCIVQGTASQAEEFCGMHRFPGHCVPDPEKSTYKAMGLGRTSWGAIIFAGGEQKRRRKEAYGTGCRIDIRGSFQKHSDVLQLPGAALVDRGGKILWMHQGVHTGDLPLAKQLLDVVDGHLRR